MAGSTAIQSERRVERHFCHRGYGAEFAMEVDWIRSRLPAETPHIVEVGCGGGALLAALGLSRVVGVDYAFEGLSYTAARLPGAKLICASAEALPLADASVDAVVTQHVIEHLRDVKDACREWFRVVRPGGSLLVLTPNTEFGDPSVFADETHVQLFDASSLGGLLEDVGFRIGDLRTLGLDAFRHHGGIRGGWRLRRFITEYAGPLSCVPGLRRRGQTLCCHAVRPG